MHVMMAMLQREYRRSALAPPTSPPPASVEAAALEAGSSSDRPIARPSLQLASKAPNRPFLSGKMTCSKCQAPGVPPDQDKGLATTGARAGGQGRFEVRVAVGTGSYFGNPHARDAVAVFRIYGSTRLRGGALVQLAFLAPRFPASV
jgi:hypothetical protein